MTTTILTQSELRRAPARSLPLVAEISFEDASPFGVQGLQRDSLSILKPEAVKPFAVAMSLAGAQKNMQDPALANQTLSRNPDWVQEYRVVHLIEKSLWFDGRCDFVMQMMRNPSQIPDNPPPEIREALAIAYTLHPDATVWYGVPVFGDERNAQGLPIPLTADQVRHEASRRMQSAIRHARRMGWFYRSVARARRVPQSIRQSIRRCVHSVTGAWQRLVAEYQQACRDSKRRRRAAALAQFEYVRTGRKTTVIPEHTTRLGKLASIAATSLGQIGANLDSANLRTEEFIENHRFAAAGAAVLPFMALQVVPLFLAPAAVVACDPFLFIELPDEPGKLRMIGHWYWQPNAAGNDKLHVHV